MMLSNIELTRMRRCIYLKVDISYVVTKWLNTQLKTQRPTRECTFCNSMGMLWPPDQTHPRNTCCISTLYMVALNVRTWVSQLHIHKLIPTPSIHDQKMHWQSSTYVLTACSATNLPGSAMCDMVCRSAAAFRPTCSELGQRLSHAPRG
jgi:hypothetical protein